MKITKEKNELVIKLPLSQPSYDAIDEYVGETDNLIGVIAAQEYSISQLIDLGYKGDQQEGMPIIMFETAEELRKVCKEFNISVWEHEICAYCKKAIRGCFGMGEKGYKCYGCELDEKI